MDGAKAEEVEQERAAFLKICRAFQGYAADAAEEVHRWERMFERLPPAHQSLLAHHRDKHVEAYRCVARNDKFLSDMLATYMGDDVPRPIASSKHTEISYQRWRADGGGFVEAELSSSHFSRAW